MNPTTKEGSNPSLDPPGSAGDTICGSKIDASASIWANRRRGTGFRFAEIVCERNKYCFAHSLREFLLTAGGGHFALRKSHVQGFWLTAVAKGFRFPVNCPRFPTVCQQNDIVCSGGKPQCPAGKRMTSSREISTTREAKSSRREKETPKAKAKFDSNQNNPNERFPPKAVSQNRN